jgi:concanavalin A-like lectin/glucanase superfamily protein
VRSATLALILLAGPAAALAAATDVPLPSAYWSFDVCRDGRALDDTRPARDVTDAVLQSGASCVPGKYSGAASFDGIDDYAQVPDHPSLNFTTRLTVSAWVNPAEVSGSRTIVNKWYAMDSYGLFVSDGRFLFAISVPGGNWGTVYSVSAPASPGRWSHVAGVFDGQQLALYVDGVQRDSRSLASPVALQRSTRPLVMGNHPSWNAFRGLLDEVRLYDAALDASQVQRLFAGGKKALLLIFGPVIEARGGAPLWQVLGWNDPDELVRRYRHAVRESTGGQVDFLVARRLEVDGFPRKSDGFEYTDDTYLQCASSPASCHQPDGADYARILDSYDVCGSLNGGDIDELWLFGGPWFGYYESRLAGPGAFWYNSPPLDGTSCTRLLPVMGFNYERGEAEMLHSLGHRAESAMTHVFRGWDVTQSRNDWDRYGHNLGQTPGVSLYQCGTVHFPPNGRYDYDYASAEVVASACNDWRGFPDLQGTVQSFGCEEWGCSQVGYMQWWLSHLPRTTGSRQGVNNNWWDYIVDHRYSPLVIGFSSEYQSGWASNVLDGTRGVCNSGEWATRGQPTGWVQIQVADTVDYVLLYDRACPERVTAGHLELSNGETIPFGPLEDGGTVATPVIVQRSGLRWIKVFIDSATGGPNPGLGEVIVSP